MMFIALVALGLPPLPPPPVILSLTPETAPLRAPLTGDSPLATASPPLATALPIGPPPATSSSLSVSPPTPPVTLCIARSPSAFNTSCPAPLSLSIAVLSDIGHHLPERFCVVFLAAVFAVFLAAVFLAGAFFAVFFAAVFFAAVFFAADLLAGALLAVFRAAEPVLLAAPVAPWAVDRAEAAFLAGERRAGRRRRGRSSASSSPSPWSSGSSGSSASSGSSSGS